MIKNRYILIILGVFFYSTLSGQIKRVFVETYYIADDDDFTNTTGGQLPTDSKTYRIFAELNDGSKITKMYGDKNHALIFRSTAPFYNNTEDGVSLAYELTRARLKDNTVALDSWLTLGQVTKSGSVTLSGIPKDMDTNGSIIGGINNDGGSEMITSGLLKNNAAALGIPLTTSDGLMPFVSPPSLWLNQGFFDLVTSEETTVFGSDIAGNVFYSNDVFISNSGTSGVTDQNIVLIGQITTAGELSFELNFELITKDGEIKKCVSNDSILLSDETFLPLLKYPLVCGCLDPDYIEFSTGFACGDSTKCINPVVFGCMDTLACNFNKSANFNISTLCCYIGYCNDIDLEIICPELDPRRNDGGIYLRIYPNPAHDVITLEHDVHPAVKTVVQIIDIFGKVVLEQTLTSAEKETIHVSDLLPGYYILRIFNNRGKVSKKFAKIN